MVFASQGLRKSQPLRGQEQKAIEREQAKKKTDKYRYRGIL